MTHQSLTLPAEPGEALAVIREHSRDVPVLVFKKSPICPVSRHAEAELGEFLAHLGEGVALAVVEIDVIAERELARGLTADLEVRHESPQALWFRNGELSWHGSHEQVSEANLEAQLG